MGLFWYGLEGNREGKLQKQQQQHQNEVGGGKLQAKKNTQQYYFQCGDLNVTLFVLLEKERKKIY